MCVTKLQYQYGVSTNGDSLAMKYVNRHDFSYNVGSRLFLMASETKYQTFKLLGNEFAFDVDASKLGCGLNGAIYLVSVANFLPSPRQKP